MEKKKIIKISIWSSSIAVIAGLSIGGIVYSIQDHGDKYIPSNQLNITEHGELAGFIDNFDFTYYAEHGYNAILVPSNVKEIEAEAFSGIDKYESYSFIRKISFAPESELLTIRNGAFNCTISSGENPKGGIQFTTIDLSNCKQLSAIGDNVFLYEDKLENLYLPYTENLTFGTNSFSWLENKCILKNIVFSNFNSDYSSDPQWVNVTPAATFDNISKNGDIHINDSSWSELHMYKFLNDAFSSKFIDWSFTKK